MDRPVNVSESRHSQDNDLRQSFVQHYNAFFRIAYRILRSREDAEDAVQTAYCAASREIHSFRGESSCKTWVTRIVVNCSVAQLRTRRARPHVRFEDVQHTLPLMESQTFTPEAICYFRELQTAHRKAASKLPQSLHAVYGPCIVSGVAFQKVVNHLGLTTTAAKTRLSRARRKVERALRPLIQRRAA